ncbi:PREDICTED: alpha-1,3-mannosyl-glycoprotein 4-beta-N-acetylglucosaminyltransferase C-like [Nanorana parkeri]|uniref:alpha-1,3-mannosyl-glycoprotein 4-beta-N-acetylglucosaminyltransferase C-like n=1 Tax=Nanorana parkeri TaxID=125878 RepID=UPI000854470B|nr:PREDICTED: alpha-1,3-mannosyl-glycoprotein 4-beta-N-acetylglucosaminyltransferase C-like [Nanorana parkeri]
MRRFHLWKVLCASCLAACVILVTKPQPENICPDPSDPYLQESKPSRQDVRLFDVQEDALAAMPIPYKHLLGSPPSAKRFLSIGISSVKRDKENYLVTTLQSIFSHSSPEELGELVVVVYLANEKFSINTEVAEDLGKNFPSEVAAGQLMVISSYKKAYPTLEGLKRNYNDPDERVKFRSKQNVDYAFLVNFCANLSRFYLMLEDDVTCSMNFFNSIKSYVRDYSSPWTTITFSNLGYIGKLYHNEDLTKLARFLLIFYDEMPCDWLLDLFFKSKAQHEIIRYKPSLFQHIGHFSSFQGNENNLKDKDFMEVMEAFGDHPLASCATSMRAYQDHTPHHVCFPSPDFFWGIDVKADDNFTMTFMNSTNIKQINIITGSSEHPGDTLKSGYVLLGRKKIKANEDVTCESFTKIGEFQNGTFVLDNIDQAVGRSIDCLKIQVMKPQAEWLIIRKVGIWVTREETHPGKSSDIVSVTR